MALVDNLGGKDYHGYSQDEAEQEAMLTLIATIMIFLATGRIPEQRG